MDDQEMSVLVGIYVVNERGWIVNEDGEQETETGPNPPLRTHGDQFESVTWGAISSDPPFGVSGIQHPARRPAVG